MLLRKACLISAGLFRGPGAFSLGAWLAGVWLVFGWCLAVVAGGWAREPGPQAPRPQLRMHWLAGASQVPVVHVAVCVSLSVRAPQARWQKVTMPLGIGCGIALLC